MRYINRTGINNPIGKIVKLDTRGVVLAAPSDTDVLGVVVGVSGRYVEVTDTGLQQVFIYNRFTRGDIVYLRKTGQPGQPGDCFAAASPTLPYLKIGEVTENGDRQLAWTKLAIKYTTTSASVGGTVNRVAKFTAVDTVRDSGISDDGTNVATSENIKIASDSRKMFFGAGSDMTIWYDGTDGNIKTSDVAASDLAVDCGTDKTIRLVETVWDDSMVAPTAFRSGSTSLTFNALTSTIYTHRFDVGDEIHIAVQFPHTIKVGTAVVPHLHLINKNAIGATGYNVAFNFYYTWANIGQVFPSELSQLDIRQSFQNASALTHKMLNFTAITPTAAQGGISSIFLARLVRVAAGAEPYNTGDIYTLGFDIHFEVDTMGSRQIGTK